MYRFVHVYCGLIYYQWRKSELPIENRKPEASYWQIWSHKVMLYRIHFATGNIELARLAVICINDCIGTFVHAHVYVNQLPYVHDNYSPHPNIIRVIPCGL